MKVRAKRGLIWRGQVYKAGETFEVEDVLGYAFNWLKEHRWIELIGAEEVELPPLEEPAPVKKGKKHA